MSSAIRQIGFSINELWRRHSLVGLKANGSSGSPVNQVIPLLMDNDLLSETADYVYPGKTLAVEPIDIIGKEIVDGKFTVVNYLESGGIADIYIVKDEHEKIYAAKILKADKASDELNRILREIEVMILLSGKSGILSFVGMGNIERRPLIISEFADGRSLYFKLKKWELTFKETVAFLSDAMQGLISMHDEGLVHRDIKPQNILLVGNKAKLSDFDLTIDSNGRLFTSIENGISGTINYISPEQIRKETVDFKSDIYSMGVACYHIFTGRLPFKGTINEVVKKHLSGIPIKPSFFNRYIPFELEELILKAMSKNPDYRPSAQEFKKALDLLLAQKLPNTRLVIDE